MDIQAFRDRSHLEAHVQALPPWAQTEREISAILSDERLIAALGNFPDAGHLPEIKPIEGGYIVSANGRSVKVLVVPVSDGIPYLGPMRFELVFVQE